MQSGTSLISPRGLFRTEVLMGGVPQPFYRRSPAERPYVASLTGVPYVVRVAPCYPAVQLDTRLEVLVTVDGRSSETNEPASLTSSRGLVIDGEAGFEGFRASQGSVLQFTFSEPGDSVAASMAATSSIGVIGIAAWAELSRTLQPPYGGLMKGGYEYRGMDVAVASAGPVHGTAAGAEVASPTAPTSFTRLGPPDTLAIGYLPMGQLIARGIAGPTLPDPFPGGGLPTGYEKYRR